MVLINLNVFRDYIGNLLKVTELIVEEILLSFQKMTTIYFYTLDIILKMPICWKNFPYGF